MKKALFAFAIATSLSAPSFAADRGQGRGNDRGSSGDVFEIFESQGKCQSRLIELRNDIRSGVGLNASGGLTSFVCRVITKGPLEGLVELVRQ